MRAKCRIETLRCYLKRNKIFFEVMAALALPSIAILVSVQSNRIIHQQTSIMNLQTEIMRQQVLPRFDVSPRQVYNEAEGKFTDDEIQVYNRGGMLMNFDCDTAVFLVMTYENRDQFHALRIPIHGYFGTQICTGSGQGLLRTLRGYRNNLKFTDLSNALMRFRNTHGISYALLKDEKYIRLRYTDLLGTRHVEYYVMSVGAGRSVDGTQGKRIFDEYDSACRDGKATDFTTLTSQQLVAMMGKQ